jgi:hypothetical protein
MALPNGTSGYQVGAGNSAEPIMGVLGPVTAYAGASGTIAVADLVNGVFSVDAGSTSAGTYSFAAASLVDAAVASARVGSTFDFFCVNLGDDAGNDVTFSGTGWTLVGSAVVADGTSAHFRARKTGDATWTCYRIS